MTVTINIPDELLSILPADSSKVARAGLELFILEAYRLGNISDSYASELLGLSSRFEFHTFLAERGLHVNYGVDELKEDMAALESLKELHSDACL